MSHLLYGVAYYDEYMPEDRLAKDIVLMCETGISVVHIARSTWSTLGPEEGQYSFYHTGRVLEAMHEAGIAAIVGMPAYAVSAWLTAKHPDILVTTVAGQQKYGPRQIMDIVNPTFRRYAEKIIRTLMAHMQHHPAIIGWQLGNETKYYDNIGRYMQEGFTHNLQEKHPDLRQLNCDFGLDYRSDRIDRWQDFPPVESIINASLACAFFRYQRQQVTEYLAWQAAIVREHAQPHQSVTHNFDFEWCGYSYGMQLRVDHFAATQALDIAGVGIYHPSQAHLTGREIAFGGAITRLLKPGQNYFALKIQAQGFAQWTPFPGQLRLQALSHIASGAAMVSCWYWHSAHNAFETYWKGLLSHDFSRNPTWQEVTSIGADSTRLSPQLAELKAENDVVLLTSNEAMDALNHLRPDDAEGDIYNDIFRRFHDTLHDHNIGLDITHDVSEETPRYRALIVPGLYAADDGLLTRINDYIARGGRTLIGFKSGFSDENVKVRNSAQPGILCQSCDVSYSQFTLSEGTAVSPYCAEIDCRNDNQAELWMELLTLDGGTRTLLCYQYPAWGEYAAATVADYGQGHVLYVGFLPHKRLISQLFDVLTVGLTLNSRASAYRYPLVVKKTSNQAGNTIHFPFNYSGEALDVVSEAVGTMLLSGEAVDVGQSSRLGVWEFTIIESQRHGGAQVGERIELDINELLNFSPLMKTFTFNAWVVVGLTSVTRGSTLDYYINHPQGMKGYIINLTLRGQARVKAGDGFLLCRENDLLLFPPGVPYHYGRDEHSEYWDHLWIYFILRPYWID